MKSYMIFTDKLNKLIKRYQQEIGLEMMWFFRQIKSITSFSIC